MTESWEKINVDIPLKEIERDARGEGKELAGETGEKKKVAEKKKRKEKKSKKKGGIQSKAIKKLTHPLERSITAFFLITLFFTLLALLSGVPLVIVLVLLIPPSVIVKKLFSCQFKSHNSTVSPPTALEEYWLYDKVANNHRQGISTCLLFLDKGLSIEQLRDVIMTRILQKPEMAKFRSILVRKGLSKKPFWVRLSYEQFEIEKQIIEESCINSNRDLKEKLLKLMPTSFPSEIPPWEIRWCYATYLEQIILILRIHQAICDGISLTKILVEQLADQAPPTTTTFIKTSQGTTTTTGHFKPRFGGLNFAVNLCRAVIVGPLTFMLWIFWAFSRRKNNCLTSWTYFSKYRVESQNATWNSNSNLSNLSSKSVEDCDPLKSLYWTSLDLPKINRIKQVTRSCLNDVILSAISGAIRQYMVTKGKLSNPPDLGISLPVDIKNINEYDSNDIGVNYVMLTSPLPTNTEGAIPRLWEIRHLMEELKTSADPAVMYGAQRFLNLLLPTSLARCILNVIHRNSSVCLTNLQGPQQELTIGSHRLRKIHFWMSCQPNIPVLFNVITYNDRLYVSISTTSQLLPCAKSLAKYFKEQINQLSLLLSRRRVPGEARHRRRKDHFLIDKPISETNLFPTSSATGPSPTSIDLTVKLNDVQMELFKLTEALELYPEQKRDVSARLEELKEEFSLLMKEIRRRKSIADYGVHTIVSPKPVDDEADDDEDDDEDLDGELRPGARRFSIASRRPSAVSALAIPTPARLQIASPTVPARRFVNVSPDSEYVDRYCVESV